MFQDNITMFVNKQVHIELLETCGHITLMRSVVILYTERVCACGGSTGIGYQ